MMHALVRHKVAELISLLNDDERLREERKKAKANRDKYSGVGATDDYSAPRKYGKIRMYFSQSSWLIPDTSIRPAAESSWNPSASDKKPAPVSDDEDFDPRGSSKPAAAPAPSRPAPPQGSQLWSLIYALINIDDDFGDFSTAPGQQPVVAKPAAAPVATFAAPAAAPVFAAPAAAKPAPKNLLDDFDFLGG